MTLFPTCLSCDTPLIIPWGFACRLLAGELARMGNYIHAFTMSLLGNHFSMYFSADWCLTQVLIEVFFFFFGRKCNKILLHCEKTDRKDHLRSPKIQARTTKPTKPKPRTTLREGAHWGPARSPRDSQFSTFAEEGETRPNIVKLVQVTVSGFRMKPTAPFCMLPRHMPMVDGRLLD
jgi:hypothetical protein